MKLCSGERNKGVTVLSKIDILMNYIVIRSKGDVTVLLNLPESVTD